MESKIMSSNMSLSPSVVALPSNEMESSSSRTAFSEGYASSVAEPAGRMEVTLSAFCTNIDLIFPHRPPLPSEPVSRRVSLLAVTSLFDVGAAMGTIPQ